MLPIKNLYTREDNLEKYVSNFTHDLLFNNNFKTKILENIQTIVNDNISFKLNENEILLIESMIKDYYSSLKKKSSKYINHKVFEDMIPSDILSMVEEHKSFNMDLDELEEKEEEQEPEEELEQKEEKQEPLVEEAKMLSPINEEPEAVVEEEQEPAAVEEEEQREAM